jgi:hypothetical protein
VSMLHVSGQPLSLAFHAYDKHLFVANESDMIRCARRLSVHLPQTDSIFQRVELVDAETTEPLQ